MRVPSHLPMRCQEAQAAALRERGVPMSDERTEDRIRNLRDAGEEIGISQVGPRQRSQPALGRSRLLAPATDGMMQSGNKGGNVRTAIKKERNTGIGRPPPGQKLRPDKDGALEVWDPRAEYDARDHRT